MNLLKTAVLTRPRSKELEVNIGLCKPLLLCRATIRHEADPILVPESSHDGASVRQQLIPISLSTSLRSPVLPCKIQDMGVNGTSMTINLWNKNQPTLLSF